MENKSQLAHLQVNLGRVFLNLLFWKVSIGSVVVTAASQAGPFMLALRAGTRLPRS